MPKAIGPNALRLLNQRYFKPGEDWSALVGRLVNSVAKKETEGYKWRVKSQLRERIWLPNSPAMVNAGTKTGGLLACFVAGPGEDTLEIHFETIKDIAAVAKRGGGCGFSVHRMPDGSFNMREKDAEVAGSAHGYAYGPNAWVGVVSSALKMITQGGFRNMAMMYAFDADHPDAEEFVDLKAIRDEDKNSNLNQSLFVTDEWMKKAIADKDSREGALFNQLVFNAWKNGEPGLLFSDTINNNTPYSKCGCKLHATNPCGEQPLPEYGSCNLGSINLNHDYFIVDGEFWFGGLDIIVRDMTRFLDDIGSANVFPNKKFSDWYEEHRPIGIGVMGFADLLLRFGVRYDSEEAENLIRDIMKAIYEVSHDESMKLGLQRGIPNHCAGVSRRNITTVSIAPTGSIAGIAETSHSIEPAFADSYSREDERGEMYHYDHPLKDESYFMCSISEDYSKIPDWASQLRIQAAAQTWCDSGVSKTINVMNGVSIEEIRKAMIYAWELGCKGITVYRDGSRQVQVLKRGELTEEAADLIDCPTGVCEV